MPPTIGPVKLRKPPSRVVNTISPENGQYSTSGVVSPLSGTQRMPASPVKVPEIRKDIQRKRRILHPQERGAGLVVADRLQRLAEGRVDDHPHHHDADREHAEDVVVIAVDEALERPAAGEGEHAGEQGRPRHAQPVGAAGDPEQLEREAVEDLRQRQRQDAEEDARMADADVAEQRRRDGCDRNPDQDVELHRVDAGVAQQERDRIGADAEERGMTEGQQPGVSQQEIEAERSDRRDQSIGQELDLIEADIERKQPQCDEDDGRRGRQHQLGTIRDLAHAGFHHALPNSPVGLTSSTMAAIR